jgi:hypothetical protein
MGDAPALRGRHHGEPLARRSESWLFVGRLRNRQLGIRLQFEEAFDGLGADGFEVFFELGEFVV